MGKRLSSYLTTLLRMFPFFWTAIIGIGLVGSWWNFVFAERADNSLLRLTGGTVLVVVLTFFLFHLCGSLHSVVVGGSNLLISGLIQTNEVSFADIIRIDGPDWSSLNRITIVVAVPPSGEKKFAFAPRLTESRDIREFLDREVRKAKG